MESAVEGMLGARAAPRHLHRAAVALQLAMDHPDLVARLVLAPGACRLSPKGRQAQADLARHSRAGNNRAAWAAVMGLLAPKPALTAPTSGMGWLAGPLIAASDPADLLATVAAEDALETSAEGSRLTNLARAGAKARAPRASPDAA